MSLDDLVFASAIDAWDRDPLSTRVPTKVQSEFFRWISDPKDIEVFWRSGNQGAKTAGGATAALVLARGDKALCDHFGLPWIQAPNVGWVLTQSYKQQVDASQKAVMDLIGKWPHDVSYVAGKGKGYIENVYIWVKGCKHGDGDHCDNCSRITFHCEESSSALGGRIDWAWADEPPKEEVWREIRGRRSANKRFPKFITATPLEWDRWYWLSQDFTNCVVFATKSSIQAEEDKRGEPRGLRAEIRSTIYDNDFLSSAHIERQLADWANDPLLDARVRGDYVDSAGECPFNLAILDRLAVQCRPGRIETVRVQSQIIRNEGRVIVPINVDVEIFYDAEPDERYFLVCDLSSGIKARGRDPAEMCIVSRRKPRLVARYGFIDGYKDPWQGYLAPYGMGSLAAIMARRYNNAIVDPEMNGGWGDPFLTALNAAGYTNINREIDPDKPGYMSQRLGFRTTAANRGSLVGAIQQALDDGGIEIPSAFYIHCLKNVVMVRNDKGYERHEAAKGKKDEAFICLGEALHLLHTRPMRPVVKTNRERLGLRKTTHRKTSSLRWK